MRLGLDLMMSPLTTSTTTNLRVAILQIHQQDPYFQSELPVLRGATTASRISVPNAILKVSTFTSAKHDAIAQGSCRQIVTISLISNCLIVTNRRLVRVFGLLYGV